MTASSSRSMAWSASSRRRPRRFVLAYAESASAVDFLIRTHGEDALVSLVRSYAEGRTDDEAFEAAIGHGRRGVRRRLAGGPRREAARPASARSRRRPVPCPMAGTRPRRPRRAAGPTSAIGRGGDAAADAGRPRTDQAIGDDATRRRRARDRRAWSSRLASGSSCWTRSRRPRGRAGGRDRRAAARDPELADHARGRRCSGSASSSPPSSPPRDRASATRPRSGRRWSRPPAQLQAAAGGAQGADPRAARADPGDRAGGRRGRPPLVRELNDDLQDARIAAGLIPLTGTGIVLQLEDSTEPPAPGGNEARLPRRRARPARDRRGAVGGRRRGDRGQRRADHADHGDHRRRAVDPRQLGLPRRPPYQVTALGPRGPLRRGSARRPASSTSSATRARGVRHPGLDRRARGRSTCRPSPGPSRCATRGRRAARTPTSGGLRCTDVATSSRSRPSRSCSACSSSSSCGPRRAAPRFAGLSSQDLTVLVANLNARNDQLRAGGRDARARAGRSSTRTPSAATSRSTSSAPTCGASALYAGSTRSSGPGVSIIVRGPIDGPGVEDLINELRNAGAEAIAIEDVRLVPGVVVDGRRRAPSASTGRRSATRSTLDAIGAPDKLTGSLTRLGRHHRPARRRRSPT